MCISQYRGKIMLFSMQTIYYIALCACMHLPVFSRALPMPMNTILFWVQVSCTGAWLRLGSFTHENGAGNMYLSKKGFVHYHNVLLGMFE